MIRIAAAGLALFLLSSGPLRSDSQGIWALLEQSEQAWRGVTLAVHLDRTEERQRGGGKEKVDWYVATFRLDRIIKGDAPPGWQAEIEFPVPPMAEGDETIGPGESAVVFVVPRGGRHAFAARFVSKFRVEPAPPLRDETDPPLERLGEEVLRTLAAADPIAWEPWPAALARVEPLASSPEARVRSRAISALIQGGRPSGVYALLEWLSKPAANPEEAQWQYAALTSISSLSEPGLDALQRNYLEKTRMSLSEAIRPLAGSPVFRIRLNTLSVWSWLRDPERVPDLMAALDDPSASVREMGVVALARTLHKYQEYAPLFNAPQEAQDRAVALWKTWWEQEGRAKYAPQGSPAPEPAPPAATP